MIDPAISTEKEADYTAMVVVGVDEFGLVYILDIVRDRLSPNELINEVFRLASIYSPIKIGIEDVAFQKSLQYSLNEEMNRQNRYLPIQPLRPAGRNKDQRIRGLQPLYANGRILHSKHVNKIEFLEDELLRFPRGKHDDIIDALSYMLDIPVYKPKRKNTLNRPNNKRYLY
jgi:predicted phage terminase large subunit-like protein